MTKEQINALVEQARAAVAADQYFAVDPHTVRMQALLNYEIVRRRPLAEDDAVNRIEQIKDTLLAAACVLLAEEPQ